MRRRHCARMIAASAAHHGAIKQRAVGVSSEKKTRDKREKARVVMLSCCDAYCAYARQARGMRAA